MMSLLVLLVRINLSNIPITLCTNMASLDRKKVIIRDKPDKKMLIT